MMAKKTYVYTKSAITEIAKAHGTPIPDNFQWLFFTTALSNETEYDCLPPVMGSNDNQVEIPEDTIMKVLHMAIKAHFRHLPPALRSFRNNSE